MNKATLKKFQQSLSARVMTLGEPDICDDLDKVKYYTSIFPSAIPMVYDHNNDHPLESRINELYGDAFFLAYQPLGMMSFIKANEFPFYLFIVRNEFTFEKYVDFFFCQGNHGGWRGNDYALRNGKIKCFGCVRLLMMSEDKEQVCSRYKNAIALAFKNGKNPVAKNGKRIASYLYNDDTLIETPEFFSWDESIEKEGMFAADEK